MKIKQQYLDTQICCPATRQHILCRFIDKNLYQYYSTHGYSIIFEEDKPITLVDIEWKEVSINDTIK